MRVVCVHRSRFVSAIAFDLILIAAVTGSALKFGLSADAVMELALQSTGKGPETARQLRSPLASARLAAASLDKARSLDAAMQLLQKSSASDIASSQPSSELEASLSTLSSYFLLRDTEARGLDPASLGLSQADAQAASRAFSRYDANDDGVLNKQELLALLGEQSSEADAEAALGGEESISFDAFLGWWAQAKQEVAQQGSAAGEEKRKDAEERNAHGRELLAELRENSAVDSRLGGFGGGGPGDAI